MARYDIFIDGGVKKHADKEHREGWAAYVVSGVSYKKLPLGNVTNNEAEYLALKASLEWLSSHARSGDSAAIYSDSQLLVNQMKGEYKTKNPRIITLRDRVSEKMEALGSKGIRVEFQWIGRGGNLAGHILEALP